MPSRVLLESHDIPPEKRDHLRALWNAFMVFVLLALAASMTTLVYLAVQSQQQRDLIIECTDGKGECSKRGQEQTGKVVLGLLTGGKQNTIDVIVAALSCQADGITEQRPLAVCTIERSK